MPVAIHFALETLAGNRRVVGSLHLPGLMFAGSPTLLQPIGLSVLITWLDLHLGGSVLLTSLFHAGQSLFVVVVEMGCGGECRLPNSVPWLTFLKHANGDELLRIMGSLSLPIRSTLPAIIVGHGLPGRAISEAETLVASLAWQS